MWQNLGWGFVPHPCPILCLVTFDYNWETWLKLVMLENFQACFFKFAENEKSIQVWEHYEINISVQRKISYLGSWNLDTGFQQMDTQKWIRRRDLEVSFVISYNYIKHCNYTKTCKIYLNTVFPRIVSSLE